MTDVMTRDELLAALLALSDRYRDMPTEEGHMEADGLLLEFINDPEVVEAFRKIPKWYA